jgi:hypothetical protein
MELCEVCGLQPGVRTLEVLFWSCNSCWEKPFPFERVSKALLIAKEAIHEGDHHRMWVIDQMVRALTGDQYNQWVKSLDDEWDEGIAP